MDAALRLVAALSAEQRKASTLGRTISSGGAGTTCIARRVPVFHSRK